MLVIRLLLISALKVSLHWMFLMKTISFVVRRVQRLVSCMHIIVCVCTSCQFVALCEKTGLTCVDSLRHH